MKNYKECKLCPRKCLINRDKQIGFCGVSSKVKVARCALHFDEEPSISLTNGSGAIFFSGCNLKCCFCQNKIISKDCFGKEISILELANLMLKLQKEKAHNINLVSPTHYIPSIIEAIKIAKRNGLFIPIVYNTSGYESVDSLKLLDGYIDIYLTDFKYYDNTLASNLSKCSDYFKICSEAIDIMYKQVKRNVFNSDGLMLKGVIVRCLVLPTKKEDSKKIINYLYKKYQDNIYLSIMNQYTPISYNEKYPFLNKTLSNLEYDDVINYALNLGVKNAYIQEDGSASSDFIPKFDLTGID